MSSVPEIAARRGGPSPRAHLKDSRTPALRAGAASSRTGVSPHHTPITRGLREAQGRARPLSQGSCRRRAARRETLRPSTASNQVQVASGASLGAQTPLSQKVSPAQSRTHASPRAGNGSQTRASNGPAHARDAQFRLSVQALPARPQRLAEVIVPIAVETGAQLAKGAGGPRRCPSRPSRHVIDPSRPCRCCPDMDSCPRAQRVGDAGPEAVGDGSRAAHVVLRGRAGLAGAATAGSSKMRTDGSFSSAKSGRHKRDVASWRSWSRQAALTAGSRVCGSLAIDCLQTATSAVRPFVVQQGTTAVQKSARNAWSSGESGTAPSVVASPASTPPSSPAAMPPPQPAMAAAQRMNGSGSTNRRAWIMAAKRILAQRRLAHEPGGPQRTRMSEMQTSNATGACAART